MGHYGSEMKPDNGPTEPVPPYIDYQCQSELCKNHLRIWHFGPSDLKTRNFHPGLIELPDVICNGCLSEPTIIRSVLQ